MSDNGPYLVGLSGESYRQPAIERCKVGDIVNLRHDRGNAYDNRAIAATARTQQIGFLPRDGWLTGVILDQGREVRARIRSIERASGGQLGVVLEVTW